MGQILMASLGAAAAVLLACACCKAIWVAGNAKGFSDGYAEGRKARALRANARRRPEARKRQENTRQEQFMAIKAE